MVNEIFKKLVSDYIAAGWVVFPDSIAESVAGSAGDVNCVRVTALMELAEEMVKMMGERDATTATHSTTNQFDKDSATINAYENAKKAVDEVNRDAIKGGVCNEVKDD